MTAVDWNLMQNWFSTDLSCTVINCRQPGIYAGRCHFCDTQLYCFLHFRLTMDNQGNCFMCNSPLLWFQMTPIVSHQRPEPAQEGQETETVQDQ